MPRSSSGQFLVGGLFLLLLGIVFIGMGATVLAVVQGNAPDSKVTNGFHDSVSTGAPILLFMALVCCWACTFRRRWTRCCTRPPPSWR